METSQTPPPLLPDMVDSERSDRHEMVEYPVHSQALGIAANLHDEGVVLASNVLETSISYPSRRVSRQSYGGEVDAILNGSYYNIHGAAMNEEQHVKTVSTFPGLVDRHAGTTANRSTVAPVQDAEVTTAAETMGEGWNSRVGPEGRTYYRHESSSHETFTSPISQLRTEALEFLEGYDASAPSFLNSYFRYCHGPAAACLVAPFGFSRSVETTSLESFKNGVLIIENIDSTWIQALIDLKVNISFLADHLAREVDSDPDTPLDKLRTLERRKNRLNGLKVTHWDIVLGDDGCSVVILGPTLVSDNPLYVLFGVGRLSLYELNRSRRIVLFDRPERHTTSRFVKQGLPLLPTRMVPVHGSLPKSADSAQDRLDLMDVIKTHCERNFDSTMTQACSSDPNWCWDVAAGVLVANMNVFSNSLDYFTFKAINRPTIDDFQALNLDRQRVDTTLKQLDFCLHELPTAYAKVMNQLTHLRQRAIELRKGFDDALQLLIGVSSVLDADTQKRLATDSRIQARRATALTTLAAIYLPLSLATSVYGMNIQGINDHPPQWWAALVLALGLLIVSVPFMLWVFGVFGSEENTNERDGERSA